MGITEQQMLAIGGRPWTSSDGEKRRIYLNLEDVDWLRLVGIEIERYKSGNVSRAWRNGAKISNAEASRLTAGKVWWESGELHLDGVHEDIGADLYAALVAEIARAGA